MTAFTISGYSTALFSTWYFIEEAGVLFDCGDGITAHLLHKSRKIRYVFLSHADRDHITGLLQLNQLNARAGFPKIYYPESSGSFPALQAFFQQFDPHAKGAEWYGVKEGDEIRIAKDLIVKVLRNGHVAAAQHVHKSISYLLQRVKRKLKPEYLSLSGREIIALKATAGEAAIMYEERDTLLAYSGDTPVYNDGRWKGTATLIHEATFLYNAGMDPTDERGDRHSTLEDVMAMVATQKPERLILGHFSPRYHADEIKEAVAALCARHQLPFPVYLVTPGEYVKDILNNQPVWKGGSTAGQTADDAD